MQHNSNWDDWDDTSVPDQKFQTDYSNDQVLTSDVSNYKGNFKHHRGNGSRGRGNRGTGNRGTGNRGTGNSNKDQRNPDSKCDSLKIPTRMVGKVIGRGGSQIAELQARSAARIQVTSQTEDSSTIIEISGNDSEIAKAKELINELTEEKSRNEEYKSQKSNNSATTSQDKYYDVAPDIAKPQESKQPYNWFSFLKECDAMAEAEWSKLPPIIKEFYKEHPEISRLTDADVEKFRLENNNIVVDRTFKTEDNKPIPKPVMTFEHAFHNYPLILEEIKKVGFQKPSPIQCQAWPILLSGEDLIGIAQTGTGKTLAFLLPALVHIDGQTTPREKRGGPAVLIMAPTRELALQIDKEVKKYEYKGITSVCVYGGGDRRTQVDVISKGVDIVIATPGRMNDLNEAGHLNVKSVTYVVLDEADRMLDMGFEPQIRKVMYSIRPTRQSIMTSATWPPGVRRLADSYMNNPIQVYVGSLDLAATHSVTQIIHIIDEKEKEETFINFVQNMGPDEKVIVFCGTKAKADYLSVECSMQGIACAALHGNRDQCDREQAVADIGDGTVRILIATDVASRGLDIDDITHVLNYDFPRNIDDYVHRVGRTGRAGKFGESISYFTRGDWGQAAELIKILEEAEQFIPDELYSMAERFKSVMEKREQEGSRGGGGRGRGRGGGGRRW